MNGIIFGVSGMMVSKLIEFVANDEKLVAPFMRRQRGYLSGSSAKPSPTPDIGTGYDDGMFRTVDATYPRLPGRFSCPVRMFEERP